MTMATETREQLRERIGEIGADAYNRNGQRPCFPPYMQDAAEAVYAQALQDLAHAFGDYSSPSSDVMVRDLIVEWAAAKGIDLTEDK
jgi:hypothetical protein